MADRLLEPGRDLLEGQAGLRLDPRHDQIAMTLNATWTASAAWLRREIACHARLGDPTDRRRHAAAKAHRRLPTRHPGLDRCNDTPTKIKRKSLRHTSWPPSPARIVNHKTARLVIPR